MRTMEEMFDASAGRLARRKQLTRVLPRMAKEAQSPDLRQGFRGHAVETERHAERLERAFAMLDKTPRQTCEAMQGIEGRETIEAVDDYQVLDAGILAAAQASEHYEIACYGTVCASAKLMGKPQLARLLHHQTLEEEKKADALLTRIADPSVNER